MKTITTFNEHLDQRYGKPGTPKRTEFEIKAIAFAIGEILREERKNARMTQQELAEKTGAGKVLFHASKTDTATFSCQRFTGW